MPSPIHPKVERNIDWIKKLKHFSTKEKKTK